MSKSALLKVILLGDGGVGKSSLMNRYVTNKFDSHLFHTIGVEFLNKELEVDGRRVTLQIWDTAGQERFRSLRTPFYRGSDCCLLTFSLDDGQSFQNLANWKKEFTYYADIKDPDSFPFVVLGNKLDIPERQVSGEDARKWCRENGGHPYFETSARDATNVASAFEEAVRRIQMTDDRDGHLISTDTNTVDLQRKSQAQNSCCWAQPSVCDRKWASRRSCDTPAEGTQGVCFLQKMGTGGGSAAPPQRSLWRPRLESMQISSFVQLFMISTRYDVGYIQSLTETNWIINISHLDVSIYKLWITQMGFSNKLNCVTSKPLNTGFPPVGVSDSLMVFMSLMELRLEATESPLQLFLHTEADAVLNMKE